MDGVIVDSLHYHFLAWQHKFRELGGEVSEHSVLLHEGRNSREILPLLLEETNTSLSEDSYEAFIEEKRNYYRSIVKIQHYEGAFDVVREVCKRGFRTALVTASALRNMQNSIGEEERELFDFIITGDEIPRAKPNPDPYLTAMNHLGLSPEDCVVVENAPLGIQSAKNAGMFCVAVETTLGEEYLTGADVIVRKLTEILDLEQLKNTKSL